MLQSCGVIPYRYNANGEIEFFVGHPGHPYWRGKNYWLFIKGHREDNEDCLMTAKREFEEETGISLASKLDNDFIYLGEIQQSQYKRCVAYGIQMESINPETCVSSLDENGNPEIDAYEWKTFDSLMRNTHPSHWQFYQSLIDMLAFKMESDEYPVVDDNYIIDDSGY